MHDHYELDGQIGKGSYGRVFRARERRPPHRLVAIKVLETGTEDAKDMDQLWADVQREVDLLSGCQCANILTYLSSFSHLSNQLWLVTELCAAGSLADIMRITGVPLDEAPLAAVLACALVALRYLHDDRHMLHRDVKAANLLLTASGIVKLADFGISVQLTQSMSRRCTAIGTPHWMAPEVIQEGEYSCSADIWSLGVTAIELAELHPPHWHVRPVVRALFRIPSDPPPTLAEPDRWSDGFACWLERCVQKDPQERLTAAELLQMPFVSAVATPAERAALLEPLATRRFEADASSHAVAESIAPPLLDATTILPANDTHALSAALSDLQDESTVVLTESAAAVTRHPAPASLPPTVSTAPSHGEQSPSTLGAALSRTTPGERNLQTALKGMARLERAGEFNAAAEVMAAAMQAFKCEQDELNGASTASVPAASVTIEATSAAGMSDAGGPQTNESGWGVDSGEWEIEAAQVSLPPAPAPTPVHGRCPAPSIYDGSSSDTLRGSTTLRAFFKKARPVADVAHEDWAQRSSRNRNADEAAGPVAELNDAPQCSFHVLDGSGALRGRLTEDGSVLGPKGEVLAFIEADGRVGTAELQYVGQVTRPSLSDNQGYVQDAADMCIAHVDFGRGLLRDTMGSIIAELRAGGSVHGHAGQFCGTLEGFRMHMLRAAAAYIVLIDLQFVGFEHSLAASGVSSMLTLWQRQQVSRRAVSEALASLDDEAVVRLVEHGMLTGCPRLQRRSIVQSVAEADVGDHAAALALLCEQAARGGARALLNIFRCVLLGPADDLMTPPAVTTQRAIVRGLVFVCSLVASGEYRRHEAEGEGSLGGTSAKLAEVSELLSEESLLESVLGLAFSDDTEVRHDALVVLTRLAGLPAARSFLASHPVVSSLCALATSHAAALSACEPPPLALRQLTSSLQLLELLLCHLSTAERVSCDSREWRHVRQKLRPLLHSVIAEASPQCSRPWRDAQEAAARLLDWTAI